MQKISKIDITGITFKYILTKAGFLPSLWKLSMDLEFIKSWKLSHELGPQTYNRKHLACLNICRIESSYIL